MKSSPKVSLEEFLNNAIERLQNTREDILCVMRCSEQLLKYASLETLDKYFKNSKQFVNYELI